MLSPFDRSAAVFAIIVGLSGCVLRYNTPASKPANNGSGATSNTSSVFAVTIASPTYMVQAGGTVTLYATVTGTAENHAVTWTVNGIPGGTPATGVISTAGVYTSPAAVDETTDVTIRATSAGDASKWASVTMTVFAAPRIGVRVVNGAGEFYDRSTGAAFVPRGNNYVRLQQELLGPPVNAVTEWHTTLSVGLFDPIQVEAALTAMESYGYNVVKVWMDCCGLHGGLGNGAGGLNSGYLSNLAAFMRFAKAHHLYVIVTLDDLPKIGGYQELIDPACVGAWPGCGNFEYTKAGGVQADRKFWQDFIRGLVEHRAPMDAMFAYQLREEMTFPPDWQQETWAPPLPLLPTSGSFTAANGKTYDMSDATAVQRLKDESTMYWVDQTRDAIRELAPGALVGVGFVMGDNPYVPDFNVIAASTADFIDGHSGPGEGTTLAQDLAGWGKPPGPSAKPVMQGEFAARVAPFPLEADAAEALKQWQVEGCRAGLTGWLLWSWDTAEQDTLGFPHWYATRGSGSVADVLSPRTRPDPCVP